MSNNKNDSSLELAMKHVDAAFRLATTFLAERKNHSFTHVEMLRLYDLGIHLYNRHSSIIQLYTFHTGKPLDVEEEKKKFPPPIVKTFRF